MPSIIENYYKLYGLLPLTVIILNRTTRRLLQSRICSTAPSRREPYCGPSGTPVPTSCLQRKHIKPIGLHIIKALLCIDARSSLFRRCAPCINGLPLYIIKPQGLYNISTVRPRRRSYFHARTANISRVFSHGLRVVVSFCLGLISSILLHFCRTRAGF